MLGPVTALHVSEARKGQDIVGLQQSIYFMVYNNRGNIFHGDHRKSRIYVSKRLERSARFTIIQNQKGKNKEVKIQEINKYISKFIITHYVKLQTRD